MCGTQVSAYFCYKLPYFCAAFDVLETECIILAVELGPDDECVCLSLVNVVWSYGNLKKNLLCLL